jgi:hypothetical protein
MMQVETYEAISLDVQGDGTVVNELVSEEALSLIEALGLEGQRQLVAVKSVDGEEVQTRNPYRRMTAEEMAIYSTLMPNRVRLAEYRDGPIPLRVMQVAAHATSLNFFDKIEVWCPEPGQKDPVLVGIHKSDGWRVEEYILARWGDVLESLDVLREKAAPIIRDRVRGAIADARGQIDMLDASLEAKIAAYLRTGKDASVYATIGLSR